MRRSGGILKAMAILVPCFSLMVVGGLGFGSAFRQEIEIINHSGAPIVVTPIGTWHGSARRSALPVTASRMIHWPALKNGAFPIAPGQSLRIDYDGDDIDPTEIYVDAGPTRLLEVSVKPRSAADFDFNKDRRIEISDLSSLMPVSAPVMTAAAGANRNERAVFWSSLFLLGPLVIGAGLWVLGRILEGESKRTLVAFLFLMNMPAGAAFAQKPSLPDQPKHLKLAPTMSPHDEVLLGFGASGSRAAKLSPEYSSFTLYAKSNSNPQFPRGKTDEYAITYEVAGSPTIRLLDGYYKLDSFPGAHYVRDEELSKEASKNVYVLPFGEANYVWLHRAMIVILFDPKTKKVQAKISWHEVQKDDFGIETGIVIEKPFEARLEIAEGGTLEIRGHFHRIRKVELSKEMMEIRPFVEIDQEPLSKEEVAKQKLNDSGKTDPSP